jgi:hypothetical protein
MRVLPTLWIPFLLAALAVAPAGADPPAKPGPWALPPAGSCQPTAGLHVEAGSDVTAGFPFKTGDTVAMPQLEALRHFLPGPIWTYRERFFYEGMRLEIGPCFRDYAPPGFFQAATAKFRGHAKLDANGGLSGWVAGLPFDPEDIDPHDPQAGARWAWNASSHYQAGGFQGAFRIVDLLGRVGRAEPFVGTIFDYQLSHRADLAKSGYTLSFARGRYWVAGGKFSAPFAAREYAWRQYRNDESLVKENRTDDLLAYLPQWRRVRRLPAADVDGIYLPTFSVGVQPSQQLAVGAGGNASGPGGGGVMGAGSPGGAGGTIMNKRSGFEGLEMRPIQWSWRLVGVQDLLAPINVVEPMYPDQPDREFGPWGLSFASDRWDLRRALVLEGRAKGSPGLRGEARVLWYFDLQTLQPLYYMAYSAKDQPIDVGVFAGRWSEDRPDYPKWPEDPKRPVRVIDSVGAAFANLAEQGSWRRESWDMVSIPPPDDTVKRMVSESNLTKGR